MKKLILLVSVLATGASSSIISQVSGNYQYNQQATQNFNRDPASNAQITNNNEITIEVNGLSNIVADSYVAIFNIVQVAETADITDALMNSKIFIFKQRLKVLGIDTTKIRVDMISFVPKYDLQSDGKLFSKTFNEVPAGFELQKNVSVSYKNSATLDDIVSAAAISEIYDLVKVDYFISDTQKYIDSLRVKCLQEVKSRYKDYEILGFKFDTLRKVMADNFVTIYPQTRYLSYQAYSRPSLNAAKKKSGAVSSFNEIQKPVSKFYSQVDYDHYDIILNPLIIEPVVQISYTITVKYFTQPEMKQNSTYYILTPTGEMKQFIPK